MTLRHTRDEACPSTLVLDRWLAGELAPGKLEELEQHLATCARCQSLAQEMRRSRAAFSGGLPRWLTEHAESAGRLAGGRSRRRRTTALLAAGLGLAAAFALWARGPIERGRGADSAATRSKGPPHVMLYVQHSESVRLASNGEHVVPGDGIEFAYSTDRGDYLAVVSIDGAHHASVYYARDGRAVPIEPARQSPVDQSTVLDATLGEEVLYALFCERPIEVGPVAGALEATPDRAPAPAGCVVDRHTLVKVAR
jgi:hypothetical protein